MRRGRSHWRQLSGLLAVAVLAATMLGPEAAAQQDFAVADASDAVLAWSARRDALWLAGQAAALLLPLLLLLSGFAAGIRRGLDRLTGGRPLVTASLYGGTYAAMVVTISLPIAAMRQLSAQAVGLGAPDWSSWALGQAEGAAPLVLGSLLLGWVPYCLFIRSPRLWPLWTGLVLITGLAVALIAQPTQHQLGAVLSSDLRSTVTRLVEKAEAGDVNVTIRQADRAGCCGGGTVLGLGPTKVLAIDSALLRHHPEPEVTQVIAHELGHYVRNDDRKALYAGALLILSGIGVLRFVGPLAIRASRGRFGFTDFVDPASLPLLVLILTVFSLPASAAFHAYGRHLEQEADRFSLELTRNGEAQASLMQRYLRCSRLATPDTSWLQKTFRQNHPSFRARIALAREYRGGGHTTGSVSGS